MISPIRFGMPTTPQIRFGNEDSSESTQADFANVTMNPATEKTGDGVVVDSPAYSVVGFDKPLPPGIIKAWQISKPDTSIPRLIEIAARYDEIHALPSGTERKNAMTAFLMEFAGYDGPPTEEIPKEMLNKHRKPQPGSLLDNAG